jgi:hypothetical protein
MQRTRFLSGPEREIREMTERLMREARDLPAYQTRTCTHCGAHTTFVLQDRGGWYACIECGRYA